MRAERFEDSARFDLEARMDNNVVITMRVPRQLRIHIRRHAAEHDLPVQREIRRVLEKEYGLVEIGGQYVQAQPDVQVQQEVQS